MDLRSDLFATARLMAGTAPMVAATAAAAKKRNIAVQTLFQPLGFHHTDFVIFIP